MVALLTKLVYSLNGIMDNARTQRGHIVIREQRCIKCSTVLAVEITDKLGVRGEYWVIKGIHRSRNGIDAVYGQEVWFGNMVTCPKCGLTGMLPMDKPLTAELIALPKEKKNGTTLENLATQTR